MSVQSSQSPRLARRGTRPAFARGNSFTTQGPIPPSLVHSPYLEDPHSIFNAGPGWRYEKQLTPPNEHDKLCLMDTVPIVPSSSSSPMNSRSSSSTSTGSNSSASAPSSSYPSAAYYASQQYGSSSFSSMSNGAPSTSRNPHSVAYTTGAAAVPPVTSSRSGAAPSRSSTTSNAQWTSQQAQYTPRQRTSS